MKTKKKKNSVKSTVAVKSISEGSRNTEEYWTGVMMLKVILNCKNISQYYCFCCILDQINEALEWIKSWITFCMIKYEDFSDLL